MARCVLISLCASRGMCRQCSAREPDVLHCCDQHLGETPRLRRTLSRGGSRDGRTAPRHLCPRSQRSKCLRPSSGGVLHRGGVLFHQPTSFANPAITIGRMFSNSFAGIAPQSAPLFIEAQVVGAVAAYGVIRLLYPQVTPEEAADVVLPHSEGSRAHDRSVPPRSGDGEQSS